MTETTNEDRRANSGDRREMSVAAVLAAATLAWTISSAWIGFRDRVFDDVHTLDRRVTGTAETLATHIATAATNDAAVVGQLDQRIEAVERQCNLKP